MRLQVPALLWVALATVIPRVDASEPAPLPVRLAETGLYADAAGEQVDPAHLSFSPQYPLWSDGASKRRWISLPAGTVIDASDPDAWRFPPGTRVWKEFAHGGRAVETRYIERLVDGSWRFAAYAWTEDGSDALLVPESGRSLEFVQAPGGRYRIPSRGDCRACHEGAPAPLLGFSALQLSSERDPLAPHAEPAGAADVDLADVLARGLLQDPTRALQVAPRIAADTPEQRAALGYLHGNCGHCHNRSGADTGVPVELLLQQSVAAAAASDAGSHPDAQLASLLAPARYRPQGWTAEPRLLVPGDAAASLLTYRMRSRAPLTQMPPLGTQLADAEALALIERWIDQGLHIPPGEP